MQNASKELSVKIGKDKKGKRLIEIGGEKAVYSMITSRFLPDYPLKDTRGEFTDNGYRADTVTVVGWIKDMPAPFRKEKVFEFGYSNLFTDRQESAYASLDSMGRFTVKIPVLNSTEFFCDWKRCFVRTMFEPGKTYFMLYDFKEGRRYFMGEDCRLQDYDIQYLYLASRSPQDSWKNVIKEYNVSGDNVAHYNLPDEQQAAIERYLGVRSFPTYKLFNRDGNLLDLEVDPRRLENLARLLERLK